MGICRLIKLALNEKKTGMSEWLIDWLTEWLISVRFTSYIIRVVLNSFKQKQKVRRIRKKMFKVELLIAFTEKVPQASILYERKSHKTWLPEPFYSHPRVYRQCTAPFGRTSPASEILLVLKQPKQVQLQDLFNILFSISNLFPSSLDYSS